MGPALSAAVVAAVLSMLSHSIRAAEVRVLTEKEQDIGEQVTRYDVAFTLDSIPERPVLDLSFGVQNKGRCPITYRPTTVAVNNRVIKSIDFRNFNLGEAKKLAIDIPRDRLKVGANQLRIEAGWCQYSVDSMRLNQAVLR